MKYERYLIWNEMNYVGSGVEREQYKIFVLSQYRIAISFVREKASGDPDVQMLLGSIFRRLFRTLNLANLPRGLQKGCYYDPINKHELKRHNLEVWPGYEIRAEEFEGGLHLLVDSSTRVMRTETVLDVLADCYKKSPGSYKDLAIKTLMGSSVITR